LLHSASRARLRAASRIEGFVSMPTTSPLEPTSRAASNATSPAPLPRSSTFIPRPMPASRNRRSVKGWTNAAWACSRSVSSAVRPRTYRDSLTSSLKLPRYELRQPGLRYRARTPRSSTPKSTARSRRLVNGVHLNPASGDDFGCSPELADEVAGYPVVSERQTSGGHDLSIRRRG
jgi:hypothetical protein